MNIFSLTITLYVLIKATVILSVETEELSTFMVSSTITPTPHIKRFTAPPNLNQYVGFTRRITTTPRVTTPRVTTLRYPKTRATTFSYPTPSKSLYSYKYNTDTGIQAQEDGHFNNKGIDQEGLEARGSYNYTDNDGNTFQVSYIANENGFQPEGAHLPTVPPLIKKALQYIAEHHEENKNTKQDRNISKIGKSQASFDKRIDRKNSHAKNSFLTAF